MIASVAFWPSLTGTHGQVADVRWPDLFERFAVWQPYAGEADQPGWSPAEFSPPERSSENVRRVSAMVLDYDGTETIDGALDLWEPYYGFLHTTRKSRPEAPRFRVILPLGRSVSPFEHAAIWRRLYVRSGRKLDDKCKDPGRFWFVPGCPDRETFEVRYLVGQPMDPDELLAWPEPEPPRPAPVIPIHRPSSDPASAERRASAYVARMPEAISGQGGHGALWAATLACVQGFRLDGETAFRLLWHEYNPRCQPAWSEKEIRHKVGDAVSKSRVPTGYKLDEGRDWSPPRRPPWPTVPQQSAPPAQADCDPRTGEVPDESPIDAEEAPKPTAAQRHGLLSMEQLLAGAYERATRPQDRRFCPSGNADIDRLIGGYRPGRVTVVGAATSWGKSSWAIMATNCALEAGRRVLLVSGEDTEELYGNRFMATRANVHALAIRDARVNEQQKAKMITAIADAPREPFFLSGIGKHTEHLAAAITAVCAETQIDLVVVDYLQAFTCARRVQDRRNEITHIARVFTDAIKGAKAAGLVFSQIKRLEDGARPTKHDLKESGDVENMAEHVLMGWAKFTVEPNGATTAQRFMVVEKNKDGPRWHDAIELAFDPRTASFRPQAAQVAQEDYHDAF